MKHPQNSVSKGEYISPQASPLARQFITKGRLVLYNPQASPALRSALTGTNSLAKGASVFIVQLIQQLRTKLGPLGNADYQMVVAHLAGSIVAMAHHLKDPDAENTTAATHAIIAAVMAMHQRAQAPPQGAPPPGPPGAGAPPPPQAAPPQGPMGQLAGGP